MNPTVILTLLLLTLMAGAGILSASVGYSLGRDALTGIRQPDSRPANAVPTGEPPPRRDTVVILKEDQILEDVKARMEGRAPKAAPEAAAPGAQVKSVINTTSAAAPAASPDGFTASAQPQAQFPISSEDEGIVFQVLDVRQDDSSLVLDVSLRNQGSNTHRFLYSFMNITDNQGRTFNGNTIGLPSELAPGDQTFYGTITIPSALLDGAQSLSLALTDYPDQHIAIQMSGIPVGR